MSMTHREATDLAELRQLMEEQVRLSRMIELQMSTANRLKVLEIMPEMKERLPDYNDWMEKAFKQDWRTQGK